MLAPAGYGRARWEAKGLMVPQDVVLGLAPAAFGQKGGMAVDALEQDNADAPLVTSSVVPPPLDHLGGHVLASPNDAPRRVPDPAPVAPAQQRLAALSDYPVVPCNGGRNTAGSLLRLGFAVLALVFIVAGDPDAQLPHQALPVAIVVGRVVGPVPVKG